MGSDSSSCSEFVGSLLPSCVVQPHRRVSANEYDVPQDAIPAPVLDAAAPGSSSALYDEPQQRLPASVREESEYGFRPAAAPAPAAVPAPLAVSAPAAAPVRAPEPLYIPQLRLPPKVYFSLLGIFRKHGSFKINCVVRMMIKLSL
jgi:hypothetical protein